jgi:predicted ATPase/DNA-binding winged helix-turn-helix (wHTH) protein
LRPLATFGLEALHSASDGIVADVDIGPVGERLSFGPFCLAPGERLLTKDGQPVEIGGRAFDLLVALTDQPGRILSKRELLKRVWPDVVVEDGSLRFHMAGLRRLLGDGQDGARYIATQVGVGYAFVAAIERSGPASPATSRLLAPAAGTTNLPARLPHLIGRDQDVELLVNRVVSAPLFTIVGPAGVGKTSLAIEIGHRLCERFDGQVTFVDFSMIENAGLVPAMLAGAMGIAVQTDDPTAVVLGHLREKRILLILDNCEHVIEPVAAIVERVVDQAPDARIIATSREPLRVRSEHVHRLDALAFPTDPAGRTVQELLAYPAVELFCERAAAADSGLILDEDAVRAIADMCRRLDGMALPIELAAVQVATHGIAATTRQLGERFSLGWSGRRTAQPRQQTLQAALDWSYDLLSDVERITLERLAIFVGPFSIDAALEVATEAEIGADAVAAALDSLAAKSLIASDRSQRTGTYRLLEMTRAYARDKLLGRGSGRYHAVARRHAAFFLTELEGVAGRDEDLLRDIRALRLQLGNIRSALAWSFGDDGDRRIAVRLAAASTPVFLTLSHMIECRTWCQRAVEMIDERHRGTAIELELQASLGIALMFTRGNSEAAGGALSRALEVATLLDDRANQLRMLALLHIFHERIGDYDVALAHAERAVQIAEAMGEGEALGVAYSLSGISHHLAGDQARARQDLESALRHSPPSQRSRTIHYGFDHRNRAGIGLARALWLSGSPQEADRVARETVAEAGRLDHPVTRCIALIWSLTVRLWMGDLDKAEEELRAFSHCAEVNAFGPYIAAAAGLRAELAIGRGRTEGAVVALQESIARLKAARYDLQTTTFSIALARGLILEGRDREAIALVDETIARCDANDERFATPELLRIKADILRRTGDNLAARDLLGQALGLARGQGARAWELRAGIDLAALLSGMERTEEARALLAQVTADFPDEGVSAAGLSPDPGS